MSKTIQASEFATEMEKLVKEYGDSVAGAIKDVVPKVAKRSATLVRADAPHDKGQYKKSIKAEKVYETPATIKYNVHATNGQYRLSHLLENGHATKNGGRTKAQPHFKTGDDYVQENLIPQIKKEIENLKQFRKE